MKNKKIAVIGNNPLIFGVENNYVKVDEILNCSDEWVLFDKNIEYKFYEYDILLNDEEVISNCIFRDKKFIYIMDNNQKIDKENIYKIRYSNNPISTLNIDVSIIGKDVINSKMKNNFEQTFQFNNPYKDLAEIVDIAKLSGLPPLPKKYRDLKNVGVRTEPKIYRNDPCSCGSGKKYKKCCQK